MRSLRNFLLAGLVVLPGVVCGADTAVVLDMAGVRPGTYYYTIIVAQDGTVTLNPIPKVVSIGGNRPSPVPQPFVPVPAPAPFIPPTDVPPPAPQPQPTPQPAPTPSDQIDLRVQQLTEQTLQSGGSVTTAVGLQRAYNIVASSLESNQLPKEKTFEALRAASDIVIAQQNDGQKWTSWRGQISSILADAQNRGLLTTKEQYSGILRKIETGMKNTINTMGVVNPQLQDEINYDVILKLQQRIIDSLSKMKSTAAP